jgi:glucose-1-phosphate adenylyltransferase
MILAGGDADSLLALSHVRVKASVPFAGQYRLVDFPLSNCAHSGITDVGILTQYLPESLKTHVGIGKPWDLDRRDRGVRLLEPYYAGGDTRWYASRADALARNVDVLADGRFDQVIVMAAEHVYKMDYRPLLDFHASAGAAVTVVAKNVPAARASRYGVVRVGSGNAVAAYGEAPPPTGDAFASLSIYVFDRRYLVSLLLDLKRPGEADIAADLIIPAIEDETAFTYEFKDYWARIDTVDDYYDVTFEWLSNRAPYALDDPAWPIYTKLSDDPAVKLGPGAVVKNSIIADGSIINGRVENSVLSHRVYVEEDALVRNSIIFDGAKVEAGALVDRAILDKLVTISAGARVGEDIGDGGANGDFPTQLSQGVSLIAKRVIIPPRFFVGRNCLVDIGASVDLLEGLPDRAMPDGASVGLPVKS